jgi:hypothetical protein
MNKKNTMIFVGKKSISIQNKYSGVNIFEIEKIFF